MENKKHDLATFEQTKGPVSSPDANEEEKKEEDLPEVAVELRSHGGGAA